MLCGLLVTAMGTSGCADMASRPLTTVQRVDLQRFMGAWYVVAHIPTWIEKNAYNALESYRLDADGTIATTFTFNEGGFDGVRRTYRLRGFVRDGASNVVWGMQLLWPIRADYRVMYLTDDYAHVVIGRQRRDYAWIMARAPTIDEAELERMKALLAEQGYDLSALRLVPQRAP